MSHPTLRSPARRAALAGLALLAATGCATTGAVPKGDVVWPLPPDKPRIRYLGSFAKPEHLPRSGGRAFLDALLPQDPRLRIQSPTGLALSPDERTLFVACGPAGRVIAVDLEAGAMRLVAAEEGHKAVQPFDVAVDAEGRLFVSDKLGNAILAYDADGRFLRAFGQEVLQNPMALALDRKRQLLYVVNGAAVKATEHRVEVFSLAGEHLRTMGKRGSGPGEFNFPSYLFVDPAGNLYVADMLNFRIQVFDPDGGQLELFGQIGGGEPGTFDKIKGMAFDSFRNLYVVDSLHGVQILNARHQPLMFFGGQGFMKSPNAIVIDSRNRIFVSDYALNGVHRFVLFNTSAEDSVADPGTPSGAAPKP
jgi:sugar lactone lactonase YvrE